MSTRAPRPYTPRQEQIGDVVIKAMSKANTELFRRTGGRIGSRFLRGAPVCLLTATGKVSGRPRTVPLLYLSDGENVVVVASKGGYSEHPQWYHNVVADPRVTIQIGPDSTPMTARIASSEEKAELWPRLVEMYRDYDDYQQRADRDIPVVVCSPDDPTRDDPTPDDPTSGEAEEETGDASL